MQDTEVLRLILLTLFPKEFQVIATYRFSSPYLKLSSNRTRGYAYIWFRTPYEIEISHIEPFEDEKKLNYDLW